MKAFITNHYLKLLGITLGGLGGYAYYYFVGCASGTCPITANPIASIAYGALLGYLFLDMFKKKRNEKN